jgi:hypothetical protein
LLQGKIGIEEKLPLMVGPFAPTADLDSTASGGSGFHSGNVRDRLATIATANPKIALHQQRHTAADDRGAGARV